MSLARVEELRTDAAPGRGSRSLARARRQAQILKAAAQVFYELGLRHATMEDVARRLHTSKIALYRYFPTKDALIEAVLSSVASRLMADERQPWPGLKRAVRRGLATAREDTAGYLLLSRSAAHDPALWRYWRSVQAVTIEATRRRLGLLRAPICSDPLRMEVMARGLIHFLSESVADWVERGDPERDDEWLDWVTHGGFAILGWQDEQPIEPLPPVMSVADTELS